MKFIRKALLPAIVAAGFLGFLGVAGAAGPVVETEFPYSDPGDVCSITGPLFIEEGETVEYLAIIYNYQGVPKDVPDWEADVDLNDFDGGDSDITSHDSDGDGDTESIPDTDFLNDVDIQGSSNNCGDDDDALLAATIAANKKAFLAFILDGLDDGEVCSGLPPLSIAACQNPSPGENGGGGDNNGLNDFPYNEDDIDCGLVPVVNAQCSISTTTINAVVEALAKARAGGESNCNDLGVIAENAALLAGDTEFVASQFEDYVQDNCEGIGEEAPEELEGEVLIDVTCDEPGVFDLSFAPEDGGAASIEVVCGSDVHTADIFALPLSVEITPSLANVAHSLVYVSLWGDNGEIAFPGTEVFWTTDRCAIETSAVNTETEFELAEGLFRTQVASGNLNPATAAAVETSAAATTAPDSASRQQEEDNSFLVTGTATTNFAERVVSAVVLHCDPIHSPNVTPGPAVVTAYIERGDSDIDDDDLDNNISDNDDLVKSITVSVVGPPAANGLTVTAAPATLACGEKATLAISVKDAAGQPVSDHTFVEIVTNAGGVLAGTGAVAGQAGLVSPISSTVAETFKGEVTAYLLTSTAHVGKYEVVVTTGGGGGVTGQLVNGGVTTNLLGGLFTTAPISVQVTVECTVAVVSIPVPAPSTTAPRTGQGITPPSTGDAGLASTESNWVVGAVVAVVAALAVAGLSVKLVRDEE